ncbi:MAG TPA: phosphate ABC transporter substrate-binding protein PstS, partial [Acidobacteriaceae bacterium]|nr:phosphate ABC transporter substrate-binding protein PstS [Acidobacteriaceae bacterium]
SLAIATAVLTLPLLLTACKSKDNGTQTETVSISGAGSTFVYPAMTHWIDTYQQAHPNTRINYQSIGSGGGIQQVRVGTVDFGASDVALTDEQLKTMPPVLQIPETAGPVCITYNLPEVKQPLQLTPAAVAGIFLGTVKSWQDPEIVEANPGVKLPKTSIVVVHRADGSGTTGIFTEYLSAVNNDWKTKVGFGTSVNWPVGLGGKGNEGVTGQINNANGSIGYVELAYAMQNKLPVASVQNQAGKFVAPSIESTSAAIAGSKDIITADPRTPIVNPPATAVNAYPISGLTFLIVPKDGADRAKRAELKKFIQYMIGDGQSVAGTLNYAPLPDSVQQFDKQQLDQMLAGGQPIM